MDGILVPSTAQDRGMVMLESMVNWAGQPSTAWWVLSGAALFILVQSVRASADVFWADMLEEDE